jgi:hypothetical protein
MQGAAWRCMLVAKKNTDHRAAFQRSGQAHEAKMD